MYGYKYKVCQMKRDQKKYSLHFSNSFPSQLTHTHLLFISLLKNKKNILQEVEKKRKKEKR